MAIYYLDVDDEITTAASRIRGAADTAVAIVLPAGSRVATSRINFRLLAREAQGGHKRLSIVAPEASVRALAASAGLPVFATVGDYESALEEVQAGASAVRTTAAPRAGDRAAASTGVATAESAEVASALDELGSTLPADVRGRDGRGARGGARAGGSPREAGAARPAAEAKRRRRVPGVALLLIGLLAVAALGAGVGAYLYLPSATIVVTPRHETIGPLPLTVQVDPSISAPAADRLAIPGVLEKFPEQAANTFKASGVRIDRTRATGSITIQNCDTTSGHVVPKGTQVLTVTGVRFSTDHDVQLARATLVPGGGGSCGSGSTSVTAVTPGLIGNVAAGAIARMPAGWDPAIFFVQNAAATSGGSETPHTIVQQSDIDKAKPQLQQQVGQAFQAEIANPSSLGPGLVLFPATAQLGAITINPDPATLVGKEMATFELVATANGTALAANLDDAKTIAQAKIEGNVGSGYTLEPNSVQITVGTPAVQGQSVSVPVSATAQRIRQLDADAMRNEVKGKTAAEARSILAAYGDVSLTLWPDWVSTVPTNDVRIDFRIGQPAAPSPGPSSSASASAVPASASVSPSGAEASPTASPSASGSGDASASPSASQ